MPKYLSDETIRQFDEEGYAGPIRILPEPEMRAYRNRLESFEREHPDSAHKAFQSAHLLLPWLNELIYHPNFLNSMEDLLGPNLLCPTSGFRIKEPGDQAHAAWHQDAYYLRFEPVWTTCILAFSAGTSDMGCIEVVPGSHRWGILDHAETEDTNSLLLRHQHIVNDFDESRARPIALNPGELVVIHQRIIHGSKANRSKERRIYYLIDIMPSHSRRPGHREIAMQVRGYDPYGHFQIIARPEGAFGPESLAFHRSVVERRNLKTFEGSAKTSPAEM